MDRAARFAQQQRRLVDDLVARGVIRTSAVEAAMRAVPRHEFVPATAHDDAYADRPLVLKVDRQEVWSTISQPAMVAIMLELAAVAPGDRVLEIGTGSGWNAALLAHLVGPEGLVVTVDLEHDLVARARATLDRGGHTGVVALVADGRRGWPAAGPYDAILVTAAAHQPLPAWHAQLAEGGRLLVPVDADRELVVQQRHGDAIEVVATTPASFVPLRGG